MLTTIGVIMLVFAIFGSSRSLWPFADERTGREAAMKTQ